MSIYFCDVFLINSIKTKRNAVKEKPGWKYFLANLQLFNLGPKRLNVFLGLHFPSLHNHKVTEFGNWEREACFNFISSQLENSLKKLETREREFFFANEAAQGWDGNGLHLAKY